jgi:hypothetical protein
MFPFQAARNFSNTESFGIIAVNQQIKSPAKKRHKYYEAAPPGHSTCRQIREDL